MPRELVSEKEWNGISKGSRILRHRSEWSQHLTDSPFCQIFHDIAAKNARTISTQLNKRNVAVQALVFVRFSYGMANPSVVGRECTRSSYKIPPLFVSKRRRVLADGQEVDFGFLALVIKCYSKFSVAAEISSPVKQEVVTTRICVSYCSAHSFFEVPVDNTILYYGICCPHKVYSPIIRSLEGPGGAVYR